MKKKIVNECDLEHSYDDNVAFGFMFFFVFFCENRILNSKMCHINRRIVGCLLLYFIIDIDAFTGTWGKRSK